MIFVELKRVFRSGFINFWRNGVISAASVFVVTVTLFIIGSLIVGSAFLRASLSQIEAKVDINVYFKTDALEGEILALKKQLEALPEVAQVEYISRDEALSRFKEAHASNADITASLEILGENPLGAVLNIKAHNPSQYEGIANFLNRESEKEISSSGGSIIDSNNYFNNKQVIDRLNRILEAARKVGTVVSIILALMAVLVSFNTIRLAIYNSREEIGVMRLVGASESYVRGPFVIEGVMYGLVGAILAQVMLYPATIWVRDTTASFFGGIDLFAYYIGNFGQIFLLLLGAGILLGILSSYFAVRRYLK